MSYYTFINGKKYDRSLLEAAEALVEGKTHPFITLKDAQRIEAVTLQKESIPASRRRTLWHFLSNFQWTPEAKSWFSDKLVDKPVSISETFETILEEEFQLFHINLHYLPEQIVSNQNNIEIGLTESFRAALKSFTQTNPNDNSFIATIAAHFELSDPKGADKELLDNIIRDQLSHAELFLIPDFPVDPEAYFNFKLPALGESTKTNWVWGLLLHEMPSYYFWAVIDKMGEKTFYNYGTE